MTTPSPAPSQASQDSQASAWFNNEGGALIGVTLWMPIPDDKAALSLVRL